MQCRSRGVKRILSALPSEKHRLSWVHSNTLICTGVLCMQPASLQCSLYEYGYTEMYDVARETCRYKHAQINNRHIISLVKGLHISYEHDQCFMPPIHTLSVEPAHSRKNGKARASLKFWDCVKAVK